MKKRAYWVLLLLLGAGVAFAGAIEEIELDEAEVFIEFNSTDEDFGIQFFWDGEPWTRMRVRGPVCNRPGRLRTVLSVKAFQNVGTQGLTEGFFESAEPGADELPMAKFLARFPEGEYSFVGRGVDAKVRLVGEAEFTHTLPAPPASLSPDDDDVVSANGFVASFAPVTQDLDGAPLTPELYEVVVEKEDDDPILRVFSVILKGDDPSPSVTVPGEFLEPDTAYKLEVIVQEESGNRTISETEFSTAP